MYNLETKEVLKILKTSEKGLTSKEANLRLEKFGKNKLEEFKKLSKIILFLLQFKNPLVIILIIAAMFSFFVGEVLDFYLISAILILNACLGFFQEYKAEKSIEALKKLTALKVKVLRDSKIIEIDAEDLVKGDIVLLESGNKIPADLRILEESDLYLNEAPLTGESTQVKKTIEIINKEVVIAEQKNMLFSGTDVTRGKAKAVVVNTGMETEIGKIAELIQKTKPEPTPLQKKLAVFGKYLSAVILVICLVVFSGGILKGGSSLEMFLIAVSLAVAAIPEGLPAVVTISLALGIQRMVKKNVLVKKLPSAEALGSTTVICSDKTGTLTKGEMTVRKLFTNNKIIEITGSGYETKGSFISNKKNVNLNEINLLLKIGALNNDSSLENKGDPTELALVVSAEKAGLKKDVLEKYYTRVSEVSFSSERKCMSTLHKEKDKFILLTKGAAEVVLKKCNRIFINGKIRRLTPGLRKEILKTNEEFANQALRVLAFAYNSFNKNKITEDDEKNLIFVGLQGMIDPPRDEAKEAIEKCKKAGIKVVMITGDHKLTAMAIAKELNLKGKVLTGQELNKLNKDLDKIVEDVVVYARVDPIDKIKIIEALKRKGHIVAMTGDGVNDAPALKKADIGVAMGITGTDVSKEAADMILVDDNFSSIVNAIEEGRGIYDNIKKFVNYLLSANLGEVLVLFLAILIGFTFGGKIAVPLIAIQILWMNLITDGLPALALGIDSAAPKIMERLPRDPKEKIFSKNMGLNILVVGILISIATLFLFSKNLAISLIKAQTIAFTTLVFLEFVRVYIVRSQYKVKLFSNKFLIGAILLSLFLQLAVIYTPLNILFRTTFLGLIDWVYIFLASIFVLVFSIIFNSLIRKYTKEFD